MREIIYSIFPLFTVFFMMFYLFRMNKKKINITWNIRRGDNCYSCKEFIEEQPYWWNSQTGETDLNVNNEKFKMCTSCNRDEKLHDVINPIFKLKTLNNFKKFLCSEKSNKFIIYDFINGHRLFS